jgi:hypothetical protein
VFVGWKNFNSKVKFGLLALPDLFQPLSMGGPRAYYKGQRAGLVGIVAIIRHEYVCPIIAASTNLFSKSGLRQNLVKAFLFKNTSGV